MPLTLAGKSKVEIKAAVAKKIAKRLDIEQILNKYPSECSGDKDKGQQFVGLWRY